ncbi:helix-turn-helix domain-containing protein [Streptomyces sp. NBC_01356]|uniref:helix-turn-helix domain-containing protein n=1 Tax=Streptomyces sp. NBC_01356 TaxID=2903836 RepID=UPI002E355C4C|nr:helix-turn-helix domain-containing protein [Streptomyces sp. NBC_01356]
MSRDLPPLPVHTLGFAVHDVLLRSQRPVVVAVDCRLARTAHRCIGVSERTLARLFRTEFGMTYPQWRTSIRVLHAMVLLAKSEERRAKSEGRRRQRNGATVRMGHDQCDHRHAQPCAASTPRGRRRVAGRPGPRLSRSPGSSWSVHRRTARRRGRLARRRSPYSRAPSACR